MISLTDLVRVLDRDNVDIRRRHCGNSVALPVLLKGEECIDPNAKTLLAPNQLIAPNVKVLIAPNLCFAPNAKVLIDPNLCFVPNAKVTQYIKEVMASGKKCEAKNV